MKTRPFILVCVIAVTAALVYSILMLPAAIQRGVELAAPMLVGTVEDRLMVTVQEAIKSPEVMDQINSSIQTASQQMGDRLLSELPTAIRDAIVQMLTLSTPETQAFAQNLRNEAAAALPTRKEIEALSGQILREEINKRLGTLKLDQKTIVELAMQVIERRLLGTAASTSAGASAQPSPSPTVRPTATPAPSRAPASMPTPTPSPVPTRAPTPTPAPSTAQRPWLPLIPNASASSAPSGVR